MSAATLAEALRDAWETWSGRTALVHRGQATTYADLRDTAVAIAAGYAGLGVRPGDRIVCSASNRPEHVAALAAAWLCGAVHVGLDFESTLPELARVIELTEAKMLVLEPTGPIAPLLAAHPDLTVIALDAQDRAGCPSIADLVAAGGAPPAAPPAPSDPALVFISSGTTGAPKATIGWHGNLAGRWTRLGGWLGFEPDDVHLVQLPLAHGFGLLTAMAGLLRGGTLVLLDRPSTGGVLAAVRDEQVTVLNGAPAHFRLVLDRLEDAGDVESLRLGIGTAAAFSPQLVRAIRERLGVDLVIMYGSSEGIGVATKDQDDILLGAVGRPATESVAIVGSEREPMPVGEVGEIAFSRAVFPVRYWRDGDTNGDAWYYSGDLGRLDEEGRLFVHGRLKHQIDRGGLKVDPVEVEAALLRCGDVRDAAVIGVPNPILGESVCACVVPRTGARLTLADLRTLLAGDLAPYKLPEELRLVERIPRTPLGKTAVGSLSELVAG
ncbi:MAG: class I adenylate-forming enzyme family protein [Gaiellaceae bacterium]